MSLQAGQELTPEEVLALKQDSAATNAAVFSATNMGRAMMQGAPEYTPEEIVEMKAATAQAEITPEQVLIDKVQRIYDPNAPDPTIEEWRAGTKAEKALQESGDIDSNFVAAAKGIGGLVVTLAEGATSVLRYDPRDAEGKVIPATGALDYMSRYNPATMPLAMTDAALRFPATLNYAGELMEQSYATLAAGAQAMGGPKYRVAETGQFVMDDEESAGGQFGQIDPRSVIDRYKAKGLTLVPVTEQDREEFDFQQFLGNRARMRAIEQKRTEEVGAEPLTAAALSMGAAPLDAITGSNYMEQIWKDKLPAESQAMFMQVGADPMNWASLGAGATRLGISTAAKGAGAKFLTAIGRGAQAMSRPTEASIKQVKNFQNAVWPAGRVALYAGGLAGLNYSNLPEPLKNGMNVAAAAYVAYRGGGAVLRWTGKNFPTAGIMLRESADPLGGADKIARHMVANNPKIPASIRERVARPSQFVSMESTPARLARNEALSPRTRKLMDKLSNVYVVQGVRTASDLTTGAVKGGIIAAPFAEASRLAGDEKGADITYGAGLAFGAAGGLANRVAGARNRRVAQAESDIGRMLVDIQAAGPELQKSGGLKRWQWFDRELNRFLTDVELAGGDIGHMFQTRSFDEIARTAAMQGLFRNVDYVPLNGADFALNAKAAGQDGAAGFFLQSPEGGRPRIFVNLDARRADVEAHEFGEALFSSGAFSPEQMADMRAAIDKRYGPQGLEARAREYAEQMIRAGNARNFPGENLVVSDEQIRSMMDELSQAELQRGGTDAMDWIRREVMVEEWRMAGLDYAAIRRNVPQGANPLTFAENILGANARALGLSGVKIDPETGLAVKPNQLFKDNPVAVDDPIVNRNLRQYIKAHQQWMNDPAHEVPSGVKIAPDGRAESLANNPNVIFDANGQNPLATRDPQTGQVRWKSDKDRAKDAKLRGQQIRNVAGTSLLEQSSPQFGPKKTTNGRIRISGRRLPASLELQNHWKPQLDKIRRIEALSDAAESQQVLYVAMGASADKVKTSRPQDIVAINREVVFDEWVVQGKNNDLYAQFLDLTTIRNRAMKAIAARNPALDPANGGPGYNLKAIMDDVFQWMDDKRAGKAGEATIGQDRKNIVNALINPGTAMNKGKNPLAGSFGRGSAIKTLLADNIMAVSGTGRKGVAMDYNWANGNFMPDQPAPRPDVDSDLNIPKNNRMPQALPREAQAMPDVVHSPNYKLSSKVPARGHFLVGATTQDGRKLEYKLDPRAVVQPPVKDIGQYKGEHVMVLEADRYNTLDGRMGGPMHPWLKSNQVIVRTPDGKGYKAGWANMTSTFVSGARNKSVNNTDTGRALIQVMAEDTHRSNRDSVFRYMDKVDAVKPSMTQQQVDSLHVLLELGARMGQKETLPAPQKKFVKAMATVKSQATRGNKSNAEALFKKAMQKHSRSAWFQEIAAKFANVSFTDEAARFTFPQRSSAMDKIDGLPFLPSLKDELAASADFVGAKNLDVVASIQLSQNPDAFAVYFGKNPAEEAKMTATERNLRDQFLANKEFRVHPSYDWMMLSPENADNFILEKPVALETLFPWYRKAHPKASVKNGSPETVAGAMRKYGGIKLKL